MAGENSLSVEARLALSEALVKLPDPQFKQLVFALNPPPGILPSDLAALGDRAVVLLQWVEGNGPGLEVLQQALAQITGERVSPGAQRPTARPIEDIRMTSLTSLTGEQFEQFGQALISAFPTEADLKRMVRIGLNRSLSAIAEGANQTLRVDNLIDWAEREGLLGELVAAAKKGNSGNLLLQKFVESLEMTGLSAQQQSGTFQQGPTFKWRGPSDERELQGLLRPQRDVASYDMAFLKRANQSAGAVCRIELPDQKAIGTGFLVAKNLILTNYHVIAPDDQFDPYAWLDRVILRFGYLTQEPGEDAEGQTFRLAPNPLLKFRTVGDGLDYALLKVEDRILADQELQPINRYSSRLPDQNMNIHILQHPDGQTLKGTFSNNGITGVYERDGLIQYVSDTSSGSSGSPCFNDNWELVAMHHAHVSATFGIKCEGILFKSIYQEIQPILLAY
jgi:V8-like Glu-specific endopeptidase